MLRYKYLPDEKFLEPEDRKVLVNNQLKFEDEIQYNEEKDEKPSILLQQSESERLIELTKKINESLSHIFKKSKENKLIGDYTLLELQNSQKKMRGSQNSPSPTRMSNNASPLKDE